MSGPNRSGGDTDDDMIRFTIAAFSLAALASAAPAASLVNNDQETRTVVVSDGGNQTELTIGAGESLDFCPNGCFVTMEGERETLLGSETIEINGGKMRIR